MKEEGYGTAMKFITIMFLVTITIVLFFSVFYIVHAGERGVLLTFGNPDMTAKTEGLHFKMPFIQHAVILDVKTLKYEADATAASEDLQTVTTKIAVNYHLTPENVPVLYKEIGINYQDRIIQPAVQEVLKASTAQFTAEELITKRNEVKEKIKELLKDRLGSRSIIVEDISITNFDFSEEFNKAIESKVTAEQNALAAKNKLAQIEYEAQQRVTQAKGEAEAIRIQTNAINSQGGENYIQMRAIDKWNGIMPLVTGSGSMPFINLGMNSTW